MSKIRASLSYANKLLTQAENIPLDDGMPRREWMSAYMRRKHLVDRGLDVLKELVREYAYRRGDLNVAPRCWAAIATQKELDEALKLFLALYRLKPMPDKRQPPPDPYQAFLEREKRENGAG
jgi:hypothetical protein